MINLIKNKIADLLVLGGIFEIATNVFGHIDNAFFDKLMGISFEGFVIFALGLLIFGNGNIARLFSQKYPKIALFVKYIGIIPYLVLPTYYQFISLGYEDASRIYGTDSRPVDFYVICMIVAQLLEYVLIAVALVKIGLMIYADRKLKKGMSPENKPAV